MFEAKILSGCWDEENIELKGMPKDFVLSARTLVVLEKDEYRQLLAENRILKELIYDAWDGRMSRDNISFLIEKALKESEE